MTDAVQNIAQTLISQLGTAATVQPLAVDSAVFSKTDKPAHFAVAVPAGMHVKDMTLEVEKIATKLQPWRRSGTAKMTDLASLIAWANRHKGATSALFAETGEQPKLTCIADYIGAGAPVIDPVARDPNASHMQHRACYAFPLAPEWNAWRGIDGRDMTGPELGEFVEANAKDLLEPTPALLAMTPGKAGIEDWEVRMIEIARKVGGRFGQYQTLQQLARSFQIYEVSNIAASMNRDTGESSIQFLNEHREADGSPVSVPNLFMIAIPVFDGGAFYRVPVRFRYRKSGAAVKFIFTLHTPQVFFRDALDEALARAAAETGLPLFRGTPEGT